MYWKMSIDLTRPLVRSMGQHDPLDGFVTYCELKVGATRDSGQSLQNYLSTEIADLAELCHGGRWVTDDPLGIGGLLFDGARIAQLMILGEFRNAGLLESALDSALAGLHSFAQGGSLQYPAMYRLPFRELGLAIGLHGVAKLQEMFDGNRSLFRGMNSLAGQIGSLMGYMHVGQAIEQFWMEEKNRKAGTWTGHREINMVMLATSLASEEFLTV
jgi:hypothetical protein